MDVHIKSVIDCTKGIADHEIKENYRVLDT